MRRAKQVHYLMLSLFKFSFREQSRVSWMFHILLLVSSLVLSGQATASDHGHSEKRDKHEAPKGSHNGRLLTTDDFSLELVLFEQGVAPEFRLYAQYQGEPVTPNNVKVTVELARLGGITDNIDFVAEDDYLRGDITIYEPHSFQVTINATYKNRDYRWSYENFEGRTHIRAEMAKALGVQTQMASQQTIVETALVFGELTLPPNAQRNVRARYAGVVKQLHVKYGDTVKKGQRLLTIENNESLQIYHINAPINGVVSQQNTGEGEQVDTATLLVISDYSQLTAELNVFPQAQPFIRVGADVAMTIAGSEHTLRGKVLDQRFYTSNSQAQVYRVRVNNAERRMTVGQFVTAHITTATHDVPVAVREDAIQTFRDFQVVYAKFGEYYEVRMLALGRRANGWVEVLSGLPAGTEYVTTNSYIIKADIEKSGAAHDH